MPEPISESIDPLAPDLRVLSELLNQLPHRPSPPVVCRWILKGVNGTKLRTLKVAGRHLTTEREFRRFIFEMQTRPCEPLESELGDVEAKLKERGYQ